MENGYAKTSTLEIATRAGISKRELYALVGNKQEMLIVRKASDRFFYAMKGHRSRLEGRA